MGSMLTECLFRSALFILTLGEMSAKNRPIRVDSNVTLPVASGLFVGCMLATNHSSILECYQPN